MTQAPHIHNLYYLMLLVALASMQGCGGVAPKPTHMEYEQRELKKLWPGPPDTPRYRFIGTLTGEANFPIDKTATTGLQNVVGFIAGIFSPEDSARVLQRPQTGMVDDRGNIYVTDVSRQAVYVFDKATPQLHVWDRASEHETFLSPIGIAQTPAGEILVSDSELGHVVRLSRNGEPLGVIGEGQFQRPTGLAVDPARGTVYVADTQAHNIKIFDAGGHLSGTLGERGENEGQLNFPSHLAFANGLLYVTDSMNARVQVFDRDKKIKLSLGRRGIHKGDMPRPKGVASDSDGNIYVIESYYDHLLVYNDKGQFLLPIGGTGKEIGQFYLPAGVWADNNNYIYIADMFNGRIVVLQYLGE